ncbi:MAG: hypothetical protein FWD60_01025 [Candidatus Azobacteroides sp.]|nr:hypothetical protein [Candidatus Azobacteroides sp.]
MSTETIISNIRKLPPAEQHFVVEQVSKSIRDTERKQKNFAGIPKGYMTHNEFWHEADKRIINICKQHGVL